MFVKKLRYGDVFLILRIAYQDSKGRGKKEGEEGGLVCAVHQVKRFSCKGSIVFVGGVNFCGEWSTSASSASTSRRISKLCNREPAAAVIRTSSHFGSKKWQRAPQREPLGPCAADGAVETLPIQKPRGFLLLECWTSVFDGIRASSRIVERHSFLRHCGRGSSSYFFNGFLERP